MSDVFCSGGDMENLITIVLGAAIGASLLVAYQRITSIRNVNQPILVETNLAKLNQRIRDLEALLSSVNDAVIAVGNDNRIIYWGRGAELLYGFRASEALGQILNTLLTSEMPPEDVESSMKAFLLNGIWQGQVIHHTKTGQRLLIESTVNPLFDSNGLRTGMTGINRDVTERQRANDAIREAESRFSTIFRDCPAGISITSVTDGRFVDVNSAVLTIFGYSREEVIGKTASDLNIWANIAERNAWVQELQNTGKTLVRELAFRRKSGETGTLLFSSEIIQLNGENYILVFSLDITERKKADDEQRQAQERFSKIVRASPIAISIVGAINGRVLDVNDAFLNLYGFSRDEVLHETIPSLQIWSNAEQYAKFAQLRAVSGAIRQVEFEFRHKTGQTGTALFSSEQIQLDGEPYFVSFALDITERKRAEEVIRRTEQRFSTLFQLSPIGITISNLADGSVVNVNEAFLKLSGYSREELIADSSLPSHLWANPEQFREFVGILRANKSLDLFEFSLRNKSHEIGTALISVAQIELGGESYHISFILDVTQKKRTEEKLRESEEIYRLIVETANEGIAVVNPEGQFMYLNQQLAHMFGYSVNEVWGRYATDFVDNNLHTQVQEYLTQIRQGINPGHFDFQFRKLDGSTVWTTISTSLLYNTAGRLTGTLGMIQDCSERKRAEDALRQVNENLEQLIAQRVAELHRQQIQFSALLDAMGEGMFYDEGGFIRYANRVLGELTGYSSGELVGQPTSLLTGLATVDKPAACLGSLLYLKDTVESAHLHRGEIRLIRKDETSFDAAFTITPVPETEQLERRISNAVTIVRDITEEKQLQFQKESFVANASHELRSPLTSIKSRLYLARKQPDQIKTHLAVMENAVLWMTSLIEDLLDLSRFERGLISLHPKNVVLQDILKNALELQELEARQNQIELSLTVPQMPIRLFADPQRLLQVIINLLVNAINYTPSGGTVTVKLATDDSKVSISVTDTGIGIAPENLRRIFEPFFRAHELTNVKGTGLGLSISKAIVEMHDGVLTVESERGRGSIFTLQFEKRTSYD